MAVIPRSLQNETLEEIVYKFGPNTDYLDAKELLEDLAYAGMAEIAGHALSTHIPLNETYETLFRILRRISNRTDGFPDVNNSIALNKAARRMIDQEGEDDAFERVSRLVGHCKVGLETVYLSLRKFDEAEETCHQLQMKLQRAIVRVPIKTSQEYQLTTSTDPWIRWPTRPAQH